MIPCLSVCSSLFLLSGPPSFHLSPLRLRAEEATWCFLPSSPPLALAEGRQATPGLWTPVRASGCGVAAAGPASCLGGPGCTMPHCSAALRSFLGTWRPGRRCQLFWVPGEGLDLLAASVFSGGRSVGRAWGVHQSPGPVSHSVPDFLPGEGRAGGRVTATPGPRGMVLPVLRGHC